MWLTVAFFDFLQLFISSTLGLSLLGSLDQRRRFRRQATTQPTSVEDRQKRGSRYMRRGTQHTLIHTHTNILSCLPVRMSVFKVRQIVVVVVAVVGAAFITTTYTYMAWLTSFGFWLGCCCCYFYLLYPYRRDIYILP